MRYTFTFFLALFSLVSCQKLVDSTLSITIIPVPASNASMFPNLTTTTDGTVVMSWIHEPDSITFLKTATYKNGKWSTPSTVATGQDWFVNWADFPAIAAQADGTMLTNYLPKNSDKTYGYDIVIQQSKDSGKNWQPAITPHRDSTETEHGFVSVFNSDHDQTGIIWLDGRKTATSGGDSHGHGHGEGEELDMTLRFANLNSAGELNDEAELDSRVCSCCQTDAATLPNGGAIAVYRDRSVEEIRDISYVVYKNGKWSAPQSVHDNGWKIAGCPVNGPAIATANERVAVAYFTSSAATPKVLLALSDQIENGFNSPIQIDNGDPLGRVDIQFINSNEVIVSWLENKEEQTFLMIKRVDVEGEILEEKKISVYNPSRASGFPRMTTTGDGMVHLAWTEVGKDVETIRMVELKLN